MTVTDILPDYRTYSDEANKDFTFAGALREYIKGENGKPCLSVNWNDDTYAQYRRYYESLLIPLLPRDKAIKDYDDDDFEDALDAIRSMNRYGEGSIDRFRYLYWIVYRAGFQDGQYDDQLFWDERGRLTETKLSVDDTGHLELIPKSLSPENESLIIRQFKEQWENVGSIEGQDIGIMLMFFLGLRNNEAAGACFGDIIVQENGTKPFPCLYVTKSTVKGSNELKPSGKTRNAARILPLFDFLYEFLMKRKEFIEEKIDNGEYSIQDGANIDDFPIACFGLDYKTVCKTNYLTEAANKLFEQLEITDKYRNTALIDTIFKEKLKEFDVSERVPTCYLFRRNCATHLYALGLSAEQIQYWIGHDIENPEDRRNFHSNVDDLEIVYDILREHPYQLFFSEFVKSDLISFNDCYGRVSLNVVAEEPSDAVSIRLIDGSSMEVRSSDSVFSEGLPRTVNTRKLHRAAYKEEIQV